MENNHCKWENRNCGRQFSFISLQMLRIPLKLLSWKVRFVWSVEFNKCVNGVWVMVIFSGRGIESLKMEQWILHHVILNEENIVT